MKILLPVGIIAAIFTSSANAAEPYITSPTELAACNLPPVIRPEGARSKHYPSDECGVIFLTPPDRLQVDIPAEFTGIGLSECETLQTAIKQIDKILLAKTSLVDELLGGDITASEASERQAQIAVAENVLDGALDIPYTTFGSKSSIALSQNWQAEVSRYQDANPEYNVFPMPATAGLITFDEFKQPEELEYLGLYENTRRNPWLEYSISGLAPLDADSTLLDETSVPIFFPTARAARSGYETIEFGGGAVTASVTLNKVGYCRYLENEDQNPVSALEVTANYLMALKTTGSYTVSVNATYLLSVLKKLRQSSGGTAYAGAIADDFFNEKSDVTVDVVLSDDLKNSLSSDPDLQDSLKQTALYDLATQFLTTISGSAASRRNINLPDVADVEKYTTVKKIRRVCHRKRRFFGLVSSRRCHDQSYDVKVLQDTEQYQEIEARINGAFANKQVTKLQTYIVVPHQASIVTE